MGGYLHSKRGRTVYRARGHSVGVTVRVNHLLVCPGMRHFLGGRTLAFVLGQAGPRQRSG